MKTITLTDEQHLRLKGVLDRALDARPNSVPMQELWHACARATSGPAQPEAAPDELALRVLGPEFGA